MSQPPVQAEQPGDVLMREAPCAQCGYNLRGLSSGSLCPECAYPIAASLAVENQLLGIVADTRKVRWGLRLAAAANLLWFLTLASYGAIFGRGERDMFLMAAAGGPSPWLGALLWAIRPLPWLALIGNLGILASLVIWITGIWMLTTPGALRRGRRGCTYALRAALVLGAAFPYFLLLTKWQHRSGLTLISQLFVPATVGTALWLGWLARLIGARSLAWACVALAVLTPIAHFLVAASYRDKLDIHLSFTAIALIGLLQLTLILLLLWRIRRYSRRAIS